MQTTRVLSHWTEVFVVNNIPAGLFSRKVNLASGIPRTVKHLTEISAGIIKDHKQDIDEFRQAAESTDQEIRDFAKRYLPLLEQHLQAAPV